MEKRGIRSGIDRRVFAYDYYIPERRKDERRSGKDRRQKKIEMINYASVAQFGRASVL